jgi:hypothetical protein
MSSAESVRALVAKSLTNRIMVCYALCAIAEGELNDGDRDSTGQTLKAVRQLLVEITILVGGPEATSRNTIRGAIELLSELESLAQRIETAIRP